MMSEDDTFNDVVDDFDFEVLPDGRLVINIKSLQQLNDSMAFYLLEKQHLYDPNSLASLVSVVKMYETLYDTMTARVADKLVPDDISSILDEQE